MVTLRVGTDSTNAQLEGQTVEQIIRSLRDGKIPGINTRLETGAAVDVFVNGARSEMDTLIEKDDAVEVQQDFTQGIPGPSARDSRVF